MYQIISYTLNLYNIIYQLYFNKTREWEKMCYICAIEYYAASNEGNPVTCYKLDKSQGHYAK